VDLKKIWHECVDQERPNMNVVAGTPFGRGYETSEFHKRPGALLTKQVLTLQEGFCFLE
jgi:hypothetical protein